MTQDPTQLRLAVEMLLKAIVNQLANETVGQFMPVGSISVSVAGNIAALTIIDRDQVFGTDELRQRIFKAGLEKFPGQDIHGLYDLGSEGIIWTFVFRVGQKTEFDYGSPS